MQTAAGGWRWGRMAAPAGTPSMQQCCLTEPRQPQGAWFPLGPLRPCKSERPPCFAQEPLTHAAVQGPLMQGANHPPTRGRPRRLEHGPRLILVLSHDVRNAQDGACGGQQGWMAGVLLQDRGRRQGGTQSGAWLPSRAALQMCVLLSHAQRGTVRPRRPHLPAPAPR